MDGKSSTFLDWEGQHIVYGIVAFQEQSSIITLFLSHFLCTFFGGIIFLCNVKINPTIRVYALI